MTAVKTALVVEDQAPIRFLLEQMFAIFGFAVTSASDGASALHKAAELSEPPWLLVIDFHLPDTDALDVVAQLQRRWPQVRVLLTSGLPLEMLPARAAALSFLPKPFTLASLSQRVHSLMARVNAVDTSRH